MTEHLSPRVNSARLGDFVGRVVRLPCKVLNMRTSSAIVEATDGGQVEVELPGDHNVTEVYQEFIGTVRDASTLKMQACIGFSTEFDMALANDSIELSFNPDYASIF